MEVNAMQQQVVDHASAVPFTVPPGAILFGLTIGELNPYLQAAAYVVAVISGLCAAYYYLRKAHQP